MNYPKIIQKLKKENLKSQLILSIHDELIVDAYKEYYIMNNDSIDDEVSLEKLFYNI